MKVFPTTQGVSVYANTGGEVTIEQEGYQGDADVVVSIPADRINDLCRALKAAAKEAREG